MSSLLACSSGGDGVTTAHGDDACADVGTQQQGLVLSRDILPAPVTTPVAFEPLPDAVPVLLFHGICPETCVDNEYGMSRQEFHRTMLMLSAAGFTSVSTADYVRYIRSEWTGLPSKPILITFDDSRLDSYVGADDILRVTGHKATMFAITGKVTDARYMDWNELATAQASGRWDIQLHAHNSHVKIDGHPFLAYRLPGETFEEWKDRAEGDIWTGLSLLKQHVPGFTQLIYAPPMGDYGQYDTNDPQIPIELRSFFAKRFAAWLVQPNTLPDFNPVAADVWAKERLRYTIRDTTTAETVYDWLKFRSLRRAGMTSR
jgi:peptidoglycan/xylan/chitin deacetylase (PgdA/CDA1 family)